MPFSCYFWVPEVEPPGGTGLAARQHIAMYPVSGFCEEPGGDEHPPGDTNQFWFDFDVWDDLG